MYEQYQRLKFERRDGILTIAMHNPPLNAADYHLHDELSRVFYDVGVDEQCNVAVLTGGRPLMSVPPAIWKSPS